MNRPASFGAMIQSRSKDSDGDSHDCVCRFVNLPANHLTVSGFRVEPADHRPRGNSDPTSRERIHAHRRRAIHMLCVTVQYWRAQLYSIELAHTCRWGFPSRSGPKLCNAWPRSRETHYQVVGPCMLTCHNPSARTRPASSQSSQSPR